MSRYFGEVKRYVESQPRYAAFVGNIQGGNYPPPSHAVVISQLAGYVWMAGMGLLIFGDAFFSSVQLSEPSWYVWMKSNKVAAFAGLFIMNNLAHSLLATGAFEIFVDDQLVFSKLASKHLPSGEDVAAALALAGYK